MRTDPPKSVYTEATASAQILASLYRDKKKNSRNFSLQYICQQIGLPSKGYLGDLIAGRRKMRLDTAKKLVKLFKLEGLEKKIYLTFVQLESEKSASKIQILKKKIAGLQSQLSSGPKKIPDSDISKVLYSRVFCAVGLFENPPTRRQLREFFMDHPQEVLNTIIDHLLRSRALQETEDGRLQLTGYELLFSFDSPALAQIQYLQEFIEFAKNKAPNWYERRDESYFTSVILSVNRRQYLETLPRIREFIESLQAELEVSSKAEDLVHLNLQVFPEKGNGDRGL